MPSTESTQPGPGETIIRRTTTRYSNKIPWLPLIAAAGINCASIDFDGRMTAAGFGGTQPLVDADSPDGQANNRRVEIKVL